MENKKSFKFINIIKFRRKGITIQQVAISGMMLALITIFKLLDKVFPKTPLGYSWVELYMIFAVILVLTMPFGISLIVLISAPFLWIAIGQVHWASPLSFFLDYNFPILSVLVVYLARFINENSKKQIFSLRKIVILLLIITSFVIKLFFHTLSGVVSWETPWGPSASANAPMVFTTLAVTIGVIIFMIPKISFMQDIANRKGISW